jgi:Cu/Ag efflux protein CusF
MTRKLLFVCVLVIAFLAGLSLGGETKQAVKEKSSVTETATIVAIDSTNRLVTLKYKDGNEETIYATPEIARFDALKVGDKVTFKYDESTVFQILKPGAAPKAPETASMTASPGAKPGGTATREVSTVVTVESIDMEAPSISFITEDGSHKTFSVKEKKYLKEVKVGDKIQITYTQKAMISVESVGK